MCRCVRVSPEGFCKCARLQEDVAKVGGVRVCVCVVGVAENGGVRMPMGVYGEGKGVALGRGAVEWGQALIQKKGKTGRMGNERLPEARNEAPYSRKVRAPTRVRCKPVQTCRAKEIGDMPPSHPNFDIEKNDRRSPSRTTQLLPRGLSADLPDPLNTCHQRRCTFFGALRLPHNHTLDAALTDRAAGRNAEECQGTLHADLARVTPGRGRNVHDDAQTHDHVHEDRRSVRFRP